MDCPERHVTTLGPTLARPYSAKTAYSVGDWCLYGDWYYKCTVSIPVGEPWNPEHWERHEDILKRMPVDGFALEKVAPYLASATFSRTNFQDAKAWADTCEWGAAAGGCTAFGKGSHAYRWYDWTYDDACQTVVHVAGGYDSVHVHSVAGVAAMGLRFPETGAADNAALRFLPNRLVDGINDAHVFAEMNAVPVYGGEDPWSGDECPTVISVYECLSRFSTAAEAAAWLAEAVYTPPKYVEATGFTVHYLVKDLQETWIVEDGAARKVTGSTGANDYPAMTNFRCYSPSGERPAPDAVDIYADVAAYDPHGAGLERYIDAVDLCTGSGVSDEDVESLKYSLSYTLDASDSPLRPSDFVGSTFGGVEITTANCLETEILDLIRDAIEYIEEHHARGDGTWQSVHVADYDLANLRFRVWSQELFTKAYSFGLYAQAAEGMSGGGGSVVDWNDILNKPSVFDPSPHASSHAAGGDDEITPASIGAASADEIPTTLAELSDDATHRTVTDVEKTEWNGKQDALTFDGAPTSGSENPVKSGGIHTALSEVVAGLPYTVKTVSQASSGTTHLDNHTLSSISAIGDISLWIAGDSDRTTPPYPSRDAVAVVTNAGSADLTVYGAPDTTSFSYYLPENTDTVIPAGKTAVVSLTDVAPGMMLMMVAHVEDAGDSSPSS